MRKLLGFVFVLVSFYSYSQTFCAGSSTVISATNPNNMTGLSYSLNPGGFSSTSGNFTVSPPATTTYTIYTTGTPSTGVGVATTSFVTTVTLLPQPIVSPSYTQANCTSTNNYFNFNLTFNPANPAPSYTIGWPATVPVGITSPTQFTAANTTAGPYTAQIVAAGGCSVEIQFTITPPPDLASYTVIPFGTSHSITCVQPSLNLVANNPDLTYTWSAASFTPVQSPSVNITAQQAGNPGIVQVIGQHTVSGCTSTYTFAIYQNTTTPSSTVNPTSINLTCSLTTPPTVTVTATPSVNVLHYIYSPVQGGIWVAPSYTAIYGIGGVGVYTHVAINSASGCSATPRTFTVTSSELYPTYTVQSPQGFTVGCSTKSVAIINIQDPKSGTGGGSGVTTFTIIGPPTGTAITTSTALSTVTQYSVNVPGTWTVIVRDQANQCETRTPVSVIQNTVQPNISVVPSPSTNIVLNCLDSTVVLKGESLTPFVAYNWTFPGNPGNFPGPTKTVVITGNRTQSLVANYTLTITDQNNLCINTLTVPVYQNIYAPTVSVSATPTAITCKQPTITLTNQSLSNIPLNHPFFSRSQAIAGYKWYGPSPQIPSEAPSSNYLAGTIGIYTLVARDMNNYCRNTGTFEVIDGRVFPTFNLKSNQVFIDCGDQTPDPLEVIPSNFQQSQATYSWFPIVPSQGGANNFTYAPSVTGTYSVAITNIANGCTVRSTTASVVAGTITSEFSVSQVSGYAPLTVNFTNQSASSNSATATKSIMSVWDYGNGTGSGSVSPTGSFVPGAISSTVSPSVTYNQPGTYTIIMYAYKGACLDSSSKVVTVDIPSSLDVPNIFTPNGDGINDIYFLKTSNVADIEMSIFDRWGHLTYELTSSNGNIAWDGKNQFGKDCAEGTYFYKLKATGKDGNSYEKKGTISLVR